MARIHNMTSGNPAKQIFFFAVPLMLGNVFQQLYTVVDTAVVGKGLGVDALAAVGTVDWYLWTTFGLLQGFAQGFGILMSQEFGANNWEGLRKSVVNSVWISLVFAISFIFVGQAATRPVLRYLQAPDDIVSMSLTYSDWRFWGAPFFMAFNLLSSLLRALGDGKSPLYAMVISSLINVTLDVLFVIVLPFGVAGAAIATVIAQLFSVIYCFWAIRHIGQLGFTKADFFRGKRPRLEKGVMSKLMKLGYPMAFQNVIIGLGGMIVQSVVNTFGVIFIAGYTATNKLYGVLEVAAQAYGLAVSTYAGQNMGAGEIKRIRKGVHQSVWIALATCAVISICSILFGKNLLINFLSGTEAEVSAALAVAYRFLFLMAAFLPILYLLYVYRSALQGMGDTFMPMISGIAEFIMRILGALLLTRYIGQEGVFFAEILAWVGADMILISSYYFRIYKYGKSMGK